MNTDDPLQQNIRRSIARHALHQLRDIVEAENANEASKARALGWLLRYGWLALAAVALLIARLWGVI